MSQRRPERVEVFFLGGTIAMTEREPGVGATPDVSLSGLLEQEGLVPDGVEVIAHEMSAIASANLSLTQVHEVARAIEVGRQGDSRGAVVVQGTDTLEEVAFALDLLLPPGRPVVVTGALRRADQLGSDGPANLQAALRTAASADAARLGVLVVLNDEVHAARSVRKRHTFGTAAFSSWPDGPLGRVVEGKVKFSRSIAPLPFRQPPTTRIPTVPVIQLGLGTIPEELSWLGVTPVDAVVIAALGGGHAPSSCVPLLASIAQRAPVVLASRVQGGDVLTRTYAYPGGEMDLISRGLICAGPLDPAKARLLLQMLIGSGADIMQVRSAFAQLQW